MASVVASAATWVAAGVTWCFCSATASLLGSCCGNDKPSTIAPGATSGRKRSVLLLVISIAIAFAFQYGVAPRIRDIPVENYLTDAWTVGCDEFETDVLVERCIGQAGVYRSAFSATLFFALAAIGVSCKPSANREAWPAKYALFIFLVVGMCFVPNDPLFLNIFLNIARVGGIMYMFAQQLIFVDIAHNWNDSWVEKADEAEAEEPDSGKRWLGAIIVSVAILFLASIVGIILLFYFFAGCSTNNLFIILTLVFSVLITTAQLSGEEGSLLASALISFYATCLCYSAVSKNPDIQCNPFRNDDDELGVLIGVGFTIVSLGYAGWSATADKTLSGQSEDDQEDFDYKSQAAKDSEKDKVSGIVTNYGTREDEEAADDNSGTANDQDVPRTFSNSWKLNLLLGIVSCWFAMSLTAWGSIKSGGDAANPEAGTVSMWMIISSQWLVMTLYLWTLLAPRLFPDRDFS